MQELQERATERDNDRYDGHGRGHVCKGESDARLLYLDLTPGLNGNTQDLTDSIYCSPSCPATASSPECPASVR